MSLSCLDDADAPTAWTGDWLKDDCFQVGDAWDEPSNREVLAETPPAPKKCRTHVDSDSTPSSEVILPVQTSLSQRSPETESSIPLSSSAGARRRRLRLKRRAELGFRTVGDRMTFEGYLVFKHPLCIKYMTLPAGTRRLVSKRVSQLKCRMMTRFKKTGIVTVNGERFVCSVASLDASVLAAVETAFFIQMAKNKKMPDDDRGYALAQSAARTARAFSITAEGNESFAGGLQSVLGTDNGSHGFLDWEQVGVSRRSRRALAASCASFPPQFQEQAVFSATVEENVLALQNNRTVLSMAAESKDSATTTWSDLSTPHWAFADELCCKFVLEECLLPRSHGHLWHTLQNLKKLTKDLVRGHPSLQLCINWKAIQYLSGTSSGSQAAHSIGNFCEMVRKMCSILQPGIVYQWHDFPVKDTWSSSFLACRRIAAVVAREKYLQSGCRAQYNMQQLGYVEMERKKLEVMARVTEVESLLLRDLKPWRTFPAINRWWQQYSTLMDRYRFLVLDGPSCTGKTLFAQSLNPPGATLRVDCCVGTPTLRMFDREVHLAIVLDEITPQVAIAFKRALQASSELVTLESSATSSSWYSLYLHRVMIICCSNTWADGLAHMGKVDRDWLMSNSVYVEVASPMWRTS